MDAFEWEIHRLEKQYENNITIDDKVNEFNQQQIDRKSKRIHKLNDALDSLQQIIVQMSLQLATTPPQNQDGTINKQYQELTEIIKSIGYLYKTLESLHDTQTIAINTFKGYTNEWQNIKDRLKPHHNQNTTTEESIEQNIQTIDYFFDNYVNTN